MRDFLKLLAAAAVAATFAAPAAAAGFNGADGPLNFGGAGTALPSSGGAGVAGPRGPSGPGHEPGGANTGFRPPRLGAPPLHGAAPGYAGHRHDSDDWRRRPRHYWLGDGPIFVPDPSGDYVYGSDDYDDGGDPTGCWIYRKAYDGAHRFLGFVRVDLCEGQ
jgi:hypothetical protein